LAEDRTADAFRSRGRLAVSSIAIAASQISNPAINYSSLRLRHQLRLTPFSPRSAMLCLAAMALTQPVQRLGAVVCPRSLRPRPLKRRPLKGAAEQSSSSPQTEFAADRFWRKAAVRRIPRLTSGQSQTSGYRLKQQFEMVAFPRNGIGIAGRRRSHRSVSVRLEVSTSPANSNQSFRARAVLVQSPAASRASRSHAS
jgi:hypothetical protein